MTLPRAPFKVSFRTKVLVPMVAVMMLLLAVSMWPVNRLFKEQIQSGAAKELQTAEAALKMTQQIRGNYLLSRYRNAKSEPRFKSAATMFESGQAELNPEQRNTFVGILNDLIREQVADVIVLTPGHGASLASVRDPQLELAAFEASSSNSVSQALAGRPALDMVENNHRLFDTVTVPISVGEAGTIVGTITFGVENSMAREFQQLIQSELVLLSDGRIVASTLRDADLAAPLPAQFGRITAQARDKSEIILGGEHFLCLAGWLGAQNDPHRLGYLILSSYEKPLQVLQSTQRAFLLISSLAVLFGAVIVWLLVNQATRPLRELRDSAEAVGRGDFTRRVPVRSRDECGELAAVFNQMTGNIQQSRAQLEKTVETLKNTQAQLVQSEKLSAVGEFVAGVAHELNNPLAAVMGFSEMLQDADVDEKTRRHLDIIFKSAQRCQKIVQSLLSFARRHQPERKPVSVNRLIEDVLEIVSYPLRTSNIEVTLRLDPELPVVLADAHQVQQVFLNILNNARQAIETHQPGGKISITTEVCGPNIRITIQDNGPGISEENLRRIFDPFFTTKEVGQGTGLGLSLCYGLIKEHGGNITPVSRPGQGATFQIDLPVAHALDADGLPAAPAAGTDDPLEGAGKKVLAIDDEEMLLHMMREELSHYGYDVTVAGDGETALHKLKENHYDVIFCDWKMPGLNGRQVYEQLRATDPRLCQRVVFITGDVINEPMRKFLEQEKRPCLTKPFALAELRNVIKSFLAT